jgi:putative ABC transport system permease protein
MQLVTRLRSLVRNLFRRSHVERELDDELHAYLGQLTEEKINSGMSPEQARREARMELGGVEPVKEQVREARHGAGLETLLQDVRYGLRMLRKSPGFTAVAIITLGLGIGVNTTVFSFVEGFLLRPPPVEEPGRVMSLCGIDPKGGWMPDLNPVSAPDFLDWRKQAKSFSGMAAASFEDFTLTGGAQAERVPGGRVSADYFQVLGVAPLRGRAFEPGEDQPGEARVAMAGEEFWREHFGGDPSLVGREIKVNGENYTVVGIVPARFRTWAFPAELWIPIAFTAEQLSAAGRGDRFLNVVARLRPGVSQRQAQAEMAAIAQRLADDHPETNKGWGANVPTLQKYQADISNSRAAMVLLMGAVVFVLLIASANLANLLLACNAARQREFAIRSALGAGRWRLARQLLSECVVLSLAGAALGLALSVWGLQVLRSQLNWSEESTLLAREIYIDPSVLLFTLAVSILAALLFGLAPAFQLSRSGPAAALKETTRGSSAGRERRRVQNLLVAGEFAVSVILLVGAGLFVRSFIDQLRFAPGFNPRNVLTASISLQGAAYQEPAHQAAFFQNVLRRLDGLPQVESAAVTTGLPFEFPASVSFSIEGQPAVAPTEQPSEGHLLVSPNYFHTAQIPLLEGREFAPTDNAGSAPVVVVNEAFARKYFPNANPLGRRLRISRGKQNEPWSQVVGVVGNINEFAGETVPRPQIFEPLWAQPSAAANFVVRTRDDPAAFSGSLRRVVFAVDPGQALTRLRTMDRVIKDSGRGNHVMTEMLATFAGLALLMAAVGIYGLLAYLVGRRTQEFGVRMALGAGRSEIVRLVIRNATSLVVVGTGIGFLISLALPSLFAAALADFHVASGLILVSAPLLVVLVALGSSYLPARRATKVDPIVALRYE